MSRFKIAIIGAGPAGCTLARLLLHAETPVDLTIFEGEKSLSARTQGGTLDLHTESGIEALKRCGLHDEFVRLARFDGEAFRLCNKDFKSFVKVGGTEATHSRGRPEIDRVTLREMLIDSLPKDLIHWGYHLKTVDEVDGILSLDFRDQGVKKGYDLVVGADGAWSHVRTLLSDAKPYYSGVSGVTFSISEPQERAPDVYAIVNRGSMFAFGEGNSIMGQQTGAGDICVSTWGVKPSDWIQQFDGKTEDLDFMKRTVLEDHKGWAPELKKLVDISDGHAIPRNLYMLPVGHKWKNRPGATLLGDAAHLMTPFAGEGVNLAMTDAMHLASAISKAAKVSTTEALNQEVKLFEEDMFSRATKFQQMTVDMMEAGFMEPGAPDSNIESYILKAAGHDMNSVVYGLLSVVVYTYFFFWRRWNRVGVSGWLW